MQEVAGGISNKKIAIKQKLFSIRTGISFLIAFIVLYIIYTRIDLYKVIDTLKKTYWGLFFIGFVLFYFSIYIRGIRWRLLLKNIGVYGDKWAIIEILFISWFVNVIVPLKLGDLYRSYLIHRKDEFPMSKTLGSVFTERIFDMVVLVTLFGISGLYTFKTRLSPNLLYLLLSGFIMAAALVIGFLLMKYFGASIKGILPKRIGDIYGRFEIGALGSINKVHLIIAYTLIIWFLEAGRLQFVTSSLGLNLSMMLVIFVALASSLLTALPITPAGLGAVEFAIVEILALFGVDRNMAVSVAILDRVISYWSIIPLGYLIFIRSEKRSS